jgi:hypothetical protein
MMVELLFQEALVTTSLLVGLILDLTWHYV